jgi:hypothetical protein
MSYDRFDKIEHRIHSQQDGEVLGPTGHPSSAQLSSAQALASHSLRADTISLSGPQLREKSLLVIDDMVSLA